MGKRRLAVRIVRAPHHVVDTDGVSQANADGVLLEAQHDVAAEEVARALATLGLAESVRKSIGVTDYLGASIGWRRHPAADDRRMAARWTCPLLYKLNCGGGSEIELSVPAKEPSDGLYGFPVPERDRGFESRSLQRIRLAHLRHSSANPA